MNPTVLILVSDITTRTGGSASLMDVAQTCFHLGFRVKIGIANGRLRYLVKRVLRLSPSTPIGCRNVLTVPREYISEGQQPRFNLIGTLLRWMESRPRRFRGVLRQASLVVDGGLLTLDSIQRVRNETDSAILLNHAGSPTAVAHAWSKICRYPEKHKVIDGYRKLCGASDTVLFQSPDQADDFTALTGLSKRWASVLRPTTNEVNVLASNQQRSPYTHGRFVVVCVGSIQPRKQQVHALETFARVADDHPRTELHFVGGLSNTNYTKKLLEYIEDLKIANRVFVHGHRNDHLRFMAHADVLLQSSESEGVSRVLREAMLLRLPIVSYAISGTAGTLEPDRDALLARPNDIDDLSRQLRRIIESDTLRHTVMNSAFKRYLLQHSYAKYACSLRDLVIELTNRTQ